MLSLAFKLHMVHFRPTASDLHNNSISYKVHIRFVDRPHESLEYVRCRKGCALSESSSPGQGNVYKEVNIPLLS